MLETKIKITPELAAQHGLSPEEYARILQILGREPNLTELGIFSLMWSEHCSYKSSKLHLKRLPTSGPHVVQGPGENAGVVEIGDGLCAVFKIESHNHPSFVEPFQGAATGVGGILRDIFTMGARPIAVLDALRFGTVTPQNALDPEEIKRNRRILDGVVTGIAFYGNCFGVPTVGGDVMFEPCYAHNPLVNVLALGIAEKDRLRFARARGAGNPVIYVGAKTGRDGIHGASLLASSEFTEESQQKRPNVQVGDPFMEKLLLEACLEAIETGAVVAIQDMGAAGLTCSTCEMGSRGGTGIEIELARVPQRETAMTPYEIMLSESQERMLVVAERGRESEVFEIFRKWGLEAVEIGCVTGDNLLRVLHHSKVVAEIPTHALAEQGPAYERPLTPPRPRDECLVRYAPPGTDLTENFLRLLGSPAIASKQWVYQQYDHMVRTNTVVAPGAADAAVVRVKSTRRALALSVDGNGRWCLLDPRCGAMHAVAEAARNVACVGARPWAATNCLNFGSPEKPEVMWQFSSAIDGITEACRILRIPITGGNVSFYNETLGRSIYPTPVIGILGLLEEASCALGMAFRQDGDVIILLDGETCAHHPAASLSGVRSPVPRLRPGQKPDSTSVAPVESHTGCSPSSGYAARIELEREFSSSEYAKTICGIVAGAPPRIDLNAEKRLIDCLVALAGRGLLHSAHDISDGGLGVTLAECCFPTDALTAQVALEGAEPAEWVLFGEQPARAVVSAPPASLAAIAELAAQYFVGADKIGEVTRGEFCIRYNGQTLVGAPVERLRAVWANALEQALA
jgi:phosphoribosylformylglycinamidine synthase